LPVQLQPVFCSVSLDQRSPQHFLNKPGVLGSYLKRPIMDLPQAVGSGFIKLL
jgi:hypothetical protein